MQTVGRWTLALAVVVLAASWAPAQQVKFFPISGFGNPKLTLLKNKSVQEDLKLSEEQVGKTKELADKQPNFKDLPKDREERKKKLEEMAQTAEKALAEILKPEQTKRLKQISVQQKGEFAFRDLEVAANLKLTEEQKGKIKEIQQEAGKGLGNVIQQAKGDAKEIQKKLAEYRKGTLEKMVASLTEEQKSAWKELVGEPFKGELPGRGFFPGQGGIQIRPALPIPEKIGKPPVLSVS